MKKMSNIEMSNIEAGVKCIYHYMLATLTSFSVFGIAANWIGGNYNSVGECWGNVH